MKRSAPRVPLAIAVSLVFASVAASAQDWPRKPLRMLVGFPAGGPTDVVARLVSDRVAAQINQRILIDNRPGASGNIAVELLAKANADGHTLLYSSNAIALSPGFRWGLSLLPGQPVTMEDVLSETAITYPETYVLKMTGSQIKDVLEDVCDNLFNADPYYQQGGDMVRIGGVTYTCAPAESLGHRISDLKLDNGRAVEARKSYKVAGWASVNEQQGKPVWDVLARHLRSGKMPESRGAGVTLKGVDDNPGIAGQG